jgi:hypothetical protein
MDEVHRWRVRPRLPGVLPGQRWIRRISYPGAAGSGGEAPSLRLSANKRRDHSHYLASTAGAARLLGRSGCA